MNPLVLLFIGGLIISIADLTMKYWTTTGKKRIFALGIIVYIVGMICLSISFKYKNAVTASLILVLFNITTLLIANWFFFNEKLNLQQSLGLCLGLLSVIIIELGNK